MDTIDKPLTHTQFEILKAVGRGQVVQYAGARGGSWKYGRMTVTQTLRPLLERGLARADADFVRGRRGVRLTAAGNAALSHALHHRPAKVTRGR